MTLWFLLGLSASSLLTSLIYVLLFLPFEKTQGVVQKIFYFHVPSAFSMYAFLILGAIMAVFYLIDRRVIYDHISKAAMYTACLFAGLVITSGPIWAKPIWGVYWTWDPRLTTTFIVFILLLAYVFARQVLEDRERGGMKSSVIGAILAIFAVVDIPLIHFSVRLWRGIHPAVLKDPHGLTPAFARGLQVMIMSVFLLATLICLLIFKYLQLKQRVEQLNIQKLQQTERNLSS